MLVNKNRILIIIANKGWKIQDLVEASGVSHHTISKILNSSEKICSPLTVGKIARALGVPVEEIIKQEGV